MFARPGMTVRLPILANAVARRKHQRFDDDRHRARGVEDGADIDIVELLELETVDRNDRVRKLHLFAIMNADQAADVAVAGEHDGMAAGEHGLQSIGRALAKIAEPLERRRAAPRYEHRDRACAAAEIEPFERRLDRGCDCCGIDFVIAERKLRRDHRHVAQRQRVQRRHEDRAAGHLHRILRSADHGGADARIGPRQRYAPVAQPRAQFARQLRADIAVGFGLAAVNIFRHAAGKADVGDLAAMAERIEPQQIGAAGARRAALHGFEQTIGHARRECACILFREQRTRLKL